MLAQQGALALELWTGLKPPVHLMEQVILEASNGRNSETRHR